MNQEQRFYFPLLRKERICVCVVGYVNCSEKHDSSAKSSYHWQIFRCRQLIFSEPEIIASPAIGEDGVVYILMTNDYYKTGKLQLHLEKLNMTSGSPEPVSNITYEACFVYTLMARISPLWNQVDSYLIQGRDFLLNTSPMNAIRFKVIMRDGDMFLSVWPLRIRLPLLWKNHLDMATNCVDKWVHVLPSLKKGHVISVSSHIPDSCPFRTYKELRRHWKNMYGYRLPEVPDQVYFCSLSFHSFSSTLYTYPSLCVREGGLLFLRHMDHQTVLQIFLANMASKLPTLCGQPFGTESHVVYAVPKLCHWNEHLGQTNLSTSLSEHLLTPENKKLSSVLQTDVQVLSSETCAAGSAGSGCNILSPSCNCSVHKDALKKQEKVHPVFKHKICPPAMTQSANSVMKEKRRPLPGAPLHKFHSLSCGNLASVTQLNKGAENKKLRSRPQVQPDVNVEALARNQTLTHVNATTLVTWLRARNVPCKVKDRKSDLVEKVMDFLNLL